MAAAVKPKPKTAGKKTPAADKKPPKNRMVYDGIDLSGMGLDDLKLTSHEARYVYWYTNPDKDTFQNRSKSAIQAGYKSASPRLTAYKLHIKPNVAEAIRRLMEPLRIDVKEEFEHIARARIARIHYNVSDFYKKITVPEKNPITDEWEYKEIEVLKELSELTPEQLLALDGVDYKGMAGRKVYVFADREKAMSEMMSLYNKMFGGPANDNNEDGEATMEIIRERLDIKMTARKGKDEISRIAGLIDDGGGGGFVQEL